MGRALPTYEYDTYYVRYNEYEYEYEYESILSTVNTYSCNSVTLVGSRLQTVSVHNMYVCSYICTYDHYT